MIVRQRLVCLTSPCCQQMENRTLIGKGLFVYYFAVNRYKTEKDQFEST